MTYDQKGKRDYPSQYTSITFRRDRQKAPEQIQENISQERDKQAAKEERYSFHVITTKST
jgi:hypothetical protein